MVYPFVKPVIYPTGRHRVGQYSIRSVRMLMMVVVVG